MIDRASIIQNNRAIKKGFLNIDTSSNSQLSHLDYHEIGKMDIACEHCKAQYLLLEKVANKGNSFRDCCNHGKVVIDPLAQLTLLEQLFLENHPNSKHFLERIRGYNNAISFASFSANLAMGNSSFWMRKKLLNVALIKTPILITNCWEMNYVTSMYLHNCI